MLHTFLLGWLVTVVSGLAAYPIDTLKRRMMMTAGQQVCPYRLINLAIDVFFKLLYLQTYLLECLPLARMLT